MITPAQEKQAAKLVRAGIADALEAQRDYVRRYLAQNGRAGLDRRGMLEMVNGLDALAKEYGMNIATGKFGAMIREALGMSIDEVRAAAKDAGFKGFLQLPKEVVDSAIFGSYSEIKDILKAGERIVGQEVATAIVAGRSWEDLADSIAERLVLTDGDGAEYAVPQWRADLIATSELHKTFRQANVRFADEAGLDYYKMVGPDDDRTTPICEKYVGETMSKTEWEAISESEQGDPEIVWQYGLHYGCRHAWIPVPSPEGETRKEQEDDELAISPVSEEQWRGSIDVSAAVDEPVTVQEAGTSKGYRVPKQPRNRRRSRT